MKKLFVLIAVLLVTGCTTISTALNGGKPYTFWSGQEQKVVPEIDVFETAYMNVWCPKYPNAFACALGVGGSNPSVAIRKGFLSQRLMTHEFCHHLGFDHEVTLAMGTTDQWISGDAPCPADTSRVKYRITQDLFR